MQKKLQYMKKENHRYIKKGTRVREEVTNITKNEGKNKEQRQRLERSEAVQQKKRDKENNGQR